MKKLITLTIAICISMALILNVNAKQTVAVSRITTKSTKVTVQLPKKAKWTVTVYRLKKYVAKKGNKRGKKKAVWKKLKKLTVKSKVTTVTIPISKQKKDKKIKLVAKSGKKKYTVKTTVKKYVAKKGDKKEGTTVVAPENNNTSSDGVKFDFDAYWEDYYLRDLNNDYYKDFGFKPFSQVNNYLLVDKDSDGNIIEYGFIVGSTVHSVVWYEPEKYKVIMNQVKEIIKSLNINNSMTEQEKAFRICRYIVENTPVSDSSAHIYECLIEHKAMCMGLSQSYALLCRYVDIECECVYSNVLMHEWNIIKIGNWWYNTDIYGERSLKLKSGMDFTQPFGKYPDSDKVNNCFKTNTFKEKHPYNDISYIQQCQKDGTPYLTWQELVALPY